MSEWAQHEQAEAQKHLHKADEREALDPARQAAAAQSAELAEDVEPEEKAPEQARPNERARAGLGHFDLLGAQDEEQDLTQATASPGGGQATAAPQTTDTRGQAEQASQPQVELRPPEVEAAASRAARGGAAAELRGEETPRTEVGRGHGRALDLLLSGLREALTHRELAFTAKKRRKNNDLADAQLDELLAAVRAVYPEGPTVQPDPDLAAWGDAGGIAYEAPPEDRGVMNPPGRP